MNIAIVDDRKTDSDRLVGFIDTYAEQLYAAKKNGKTRHLNWQIFSSFK